MLVVVCDNGEHSMVLASLAQTQSLSDLLLLLCGGASAFLASYALMFGIIALSRRINLLRPVEPGRKEDTRVRLGGVAIYLAFVMASLLFYIRNSALYVRYNPYHNEATMYWLFLIASALIVLVNAYDDLRPLKPLPKLLAQTAAVIIVMGPFIDGLFHGVLLFGFSNPLQAAQYSSALPLYQQAIITIFIKRPEISLLALPAIVVTWFWMVGMMNTVNWIDGSDGLAGGVVAITGVFIAILSWRMGQDTIAILSAIFTGTVLGFLPHNWHPAKILMGDSGANFLGLGLAVLSIMGGAKVALALMVMGFPIVNIAVVIINRVRHGQHPWQYDSTHIHDRLRAAGFNPKQICYIFYGLTTIFGILALNLFHFYKLIGIALVVLAMTALILWIDHRQQKRNPPMTQPSSHDLDREAASFN
jgi:UDP-GlcNAc:undecaprenyl-phosphate/decaprenyl-phosphate GlcNAc-1-phosphate transferase